VAPSPATGFIGPVDVDDDAAAEPTGVVSEV
jgi:hypothetical protein